jgi:hypothetical protein
LDPYVKKTSAISLFSVILVLSISLILVTTTGCVSSRDALRLEAAANCPLMKNLQDNDEDLFQIEDGTGAVGEAAACPT